MRLTICAVFGLILACFCISAYATKCDTSQRWLGCRINVDNQCKCSIGCKTDLPYRSKEECQSALKEGSLNACKRAPCRRGICTQTALPPGFACKCEGTGFYGSYCEKACPTARIYGQVFPHECIVI